VILQGVFAHAAEDPELLQKQGTQRIDQYIDHLRRTGDGTSLLPELQKAQAELTTSHDRFIERQDFAAAAESCISLGRIEQLMQRWNSAFEFDTQARDLAKRAHNISVEAKALNGLARIEDSRDNFSAAKDYIAEGIRLATEAKDEVRLYNVFATAAHIELDRGSPFAAGAYLDRAMAISGELDKTDLYFLYSNLAFVYDKQGDKYLQENKLEQFDQAFELARVNFEKAIGMAKDLGFDYLAGLDQDNLHNMEFFSGRASEIKGSLLRLNEGRFHPKKATDVVIADYFTQTSPDENQNEAMAEMLHILLLQHPGLIGSTGSQGLYVQGLLEEAQGKNDAALMSYLKAADSLEQDRGYLRDEESRGTFLEDKVIIYYTAIMQLLQRRRLREAFGYMERSRSRAMADLLASRPLVLGTPQEGDLYSKQMVLKANIAHAQRQLFDLTAGTEREKHVDEIAQTEARISKLDGEYQTLRARIVQEAPKILALTLSEPVSLDSAKHLAKQEGYDLLYYLVEDTSVVIWHINGDDVNVLRVFLPRSEVRNKVAALLRSLNDVQATFDEQTSRELFLFLIEPLLKSVKTQHLIIVPHEDLNLIPFQVLQDPADGTYLGERFQISYAPSATILAALKQPNIARGHLLALADPTMHDAKDEVAAIARLYPGRSKVVKDVLVSKQDLRAWAGDYNLVHLSVHGIFNSDDPLLSYLTLRPVSTDDGHFTAAEMFGLHLPKNSFVVLSACETGRVEVTHANEVLGMIRGLLYAGASSLVLSAWQVDAASTRLWMETFYREAQRKPPSEASRVALTAVKAEYRHPFYWGPFLLTGK